MEASFFKFKNESVVYTEQTISLFYLVILIVHL